MKHILGSCVLAGLFLFCACDDTLDTKVTWQIGDSDTWRVPELAQGVLYKAYNGIANRPDCFEDNFLDCATDNAVTNLRSSSVCKLFPRKRLDRPGAVQPYRPGSGQANQAASGR